MRRRKQYAGRVPVSRGPVTIRFDAELEAAAENVAIVQDTGAADFHTAFVLQKNFKQMVHDRLCKMYSPSRIETVEYEEGVFRNVNRRLHTICSSGENGNLYRGQVCLDCTVYNMDLRWQKTKPEPAQTVMPPRAAQVKPPVAAESEPKDWAYRRIGGGKRFAPGTIMPQVLTPEISDEDRRALAIANALPQTPGSSRYAEARRAKKRAREAQASGAVMEQAKAEEVPTLPSDAWLWY